ncbi:phospholipid/cholesterol/gamma-HCH transport system ATP-binding protein [Methylopila capsulata]|uniref:ABC transporter ATP-binding protein n=1 Tax=Methylopila capsulata TaxID=61654 RepID=A0A9W6IYC4_9HYPH|nr:ATP-binding cassette domain-containing protein [Methylopila capsulata]MBM7853241.1 phospholipid/cholesterol/gamma-HCH transport system ATP-binding protein [Methylopila capsulata]GLK57545.1 ABC transporter ATP-binding protein [Methylopila capsulata]
MAEANGGTPDNIISVRDLVVGFGDRNVIDGFDLDVRRGEILGVVGPSGAGKSVTLRAVIGLLPKKAGIVEVLGVDLDQATAKERLAVERRWGVLFQQGALFSSQTVLQNIQMPLREHTSLSPKLLDEIARLKIDLVGLKPEAADRFPSELSGGMIKRAALARALALDPDIVFLDEPTAGLDPIGAADFDKLIMTLRDALGLTVYMVTHDLDSLTTACDRIAALKGGKTLAVGPMSEMVKNDDPWMQQYFRGERARAAGIGATAA